MVFWILLSVLLIVLVIILVFSNITIHLGFHRNPEQHKLEYTIYLLKKIKVYGKNIILREPEIKSEEEYKKYILRKIEKGVDIIFRSMDTISTYNDLIKYINRRLKKGYQSGNFEFSTSIGTGDAALTGLLCGIVWAILGNLRMQRDYYRVLKDVHFNVFPDFKKKIFSVNIDCIITVKTVYIIYVLKTIERIFKLEKERIESSNINEVDEENYLETG